MVRGNANAKLNGIKPGSNISDKGAPIDEQKKKSEIPTFACLLIS